jgi:hypothetical protein
MSSNLKALLLASALAISASAMSMAKDNAAAPLEECCQPGRIESAQNLIAQAKVIKLRASQTHVDTAAAIQGAAALGQEAQRLNAKLRALPPGAIDTYKSDLGAFEQHAGAYQAHLAEVEKQLGFCKATEAAYREHLAELSLHTQVFHMPNIRPPHVCHQMGVGEEETARMANSMKSDMERQAASEAQLATTEAALRTAQEHSQEANAQLLRRFEMMEAERKLAGEFAALKTEFELLHTQHDALVHAGIKDPVAISKVSASIKSK